MSGKASSYAAALGQGSGASQSLHATCVRLDDQGILITGPSGAGKSRLALELLGAGACLVADDRVLLQRTGDAVAACAPTGLPAAIEVRGIGLVAMPLAPETRLRLVVDLGRRAEDRLPPRRTVTLLGVEIELLFGGEHPFLALALPLLLRQGRFDVSGA